MLKSASDGEPSLGPQPTLLEHAAYCVVQEALTNVHKHAGTAHAQVVVRYRESDLEVVTAVRRSPRRPNTAPTSC
ncbi:hypothetical protein [Streptomyces platensis]|uniref:hypothetical protein n=1 Tax=Streptomyces platensis TaxID=58346 RepID=UPI001F2525CD|nr:hypothetical protein [Streptomyces platensis]MCF3142781.1 hypothetical protein [Streptomyces platensis]